MYLIKAPRRGVLPSKPKLASPYHSDISYGSVATHVRCGGIFSDGII